MRCAWFAADVWLLPCSAEVLDMRQQKSINAFTAHRAAVKSIVVDDAGERFFTGSTDGEIRVRRPGLS